MKRPEQNRTKKRIGIALRRYVTRRAPSRRYVSVFGCDPGFLRAFIEYQMDDRMSWGNFGSKWQIGHLLPLCGFDQTDEEECRLCWNWANTRPLRISANKGRSSYSEVLSVLRNRMRYFQFNDMLPELVGRASRLAVEESGRVLDWEDFLKANPCAVSDQQEGP